MAHYRMQPFAVDVSGGGGAAGDVEPVTASVARVDDRLFAPRDHLVDGGENSGAPLPQGNRAGWRRRREKPFDVDGDKRRLRELRSERRDALSHLPASALLRLRNRIAG